MSHISRPEFLSLNTRVESCLRDKVRLESIFQRDLLQAQWVMLGENQESQQA